MKKLYLTLIAFLAVTFATTANAATRTLYYQNFESATDAAAAGWGSASLAGNLTIASDDFGKFLRFATQANNDRSAYNFWGGDIVKGAGVTAYNVSFQFNIEAFGNNHQTTELTVMSEQATSAATKNGNYRANSTQWLFDLSQLGDAESAAATGMMNFLVNGDSANYVALSTGTWYQVDLAVDTVSRAVEYTVTDYGTASTVTTGIYSVPAGVDMAASGIFYLGGRYWNQVIFDEVRVQCEVAGDFANEPSVTMTGVNNHQRVYTMSFMEGEVLHIVYNGSETTVSYMDCNGTYVWSNNPNYNPDNEGLVTDECTSGTLEVYTTQGTATSEKVTTEVGNSIISLPAAVATISSVEEGYAKTYTLTADNSEVPLSPAIYLAITFVDESGTTIIDLADQGTGTVVELPSKGTLTITTSAFGYGETTTSVVNDIEYAQKVEYNFAHYTATQLQDMGYTNAGDFTGNYATYGRLFYYDADSVVNAYTTIPNWVKASSAWTDSIIVDNLVFTAIPEVNVRILQGVGLLVEGHKGDNQDGNWISNIYLKVNGLTDKDFVVRSGYSNYGSNALHPIASSMDEFLAMDNAPVTAIYAGNVDIDLYRISDCIARLQVFSPTDETGIVNVNMEKAEDPDAPVYNLKGMRVNKGGLSKGVYIQNGKKFVVK